MLGKRGVTWLLGDVLLSRCRDAMNCSVAMFLEINLACFELIEEFAYKFFI